MQPQNRQLFGGAMGTVLPERFKDVSDLRPVPDSQEVRASGKGASADS